MKVELLNEIQAKISNYNFMRKDYVKEVFKVVYGATQVDFHNFCIEATNSSSWLMDYAVSAMEKGNKEVSDKLRTSAKLNLQAINGYHALVALTVIIEEMKSKINQAEKDKLEMSTKITELENEIDKLNQVLEFTNE